MAKKNGFNYFSYFCDKSKVYKHQIILDKEQL